jgi:hypothetical protein
MFEKLGIHNPEQLLILWNTAQFSILAILANLFLNPPPRPPKSNQRP